MGILGDADAYPVVCIIEKTEEKYNTEFRYIAVIKQKSHLLNCKYDFFVNITNPTQLQDGTTYDSVNIAKKQCVYRH